MAIFSGQSEWVCPHDALRVPFSLSCSSFVLYICHKQKFKRERIALDKVILF